MKPSERIQEIADSIKPPPYNAHVINNIFVPKIEIVYAIIKYLDEQEKP